METAPPALEWGQDPHRFRWVIPPRMNLGELCSDRHPAESIALIEPEYRTGRRVTTFGQLSEWSNQLANALIDLGVMRGDRVALILPQCLEAGLAHLALYKIGAIAVPVSRLFGPDALSHRLRDCGARLVITDSTSRKTVQESCNGSIPLRVIDDDNPAESFWDLVHGADGQYSPLELEPDSPAFIIYTSGTTGPAKGVVHGHRVLFGHLPGFVLAHDGFPLGDDRMWTPADWAWIGSLLNVVLPCWYFGRTLVATSHDKFNPGSAAATLANEGIRNTFLPPTALKLMRAAATDLGGTSLRTIMCGGEPLGVELLDWVRAATGVTVNEVYGQTEANYLVGNCSQRSPVRPGSMGRPYPGHEVAVLDAEFAPAASGVSGHIALRMPDPVALLRYWNDEAATTAKFDPTGTWLLTGDLAHCDDDGYLWFESREDDVINSAGYRIGPHEIEQRIAKHEAVAMVGVVGVPDPVRGQRVKAFIQLQPGFAGTDALVEEIKAAVRSDVSAFAYPRDIEFVESLPLTVTGKILRRNLATR